ncbi:GDSL-type esterase/lipase family protein [Pelosinus sp. sgz500959]|uniref:GDSL-type esterase/lipase family protein n=1 Tax=Pelosinus sp. sgz500959 TaxID=3242472 RepID=UPI00366EFA72
MQSSVIKIVGIGDSITFGFPYEPAVSWFNRTAKQLNLEYINSGINGDTTVGMLERFYRHVLRHNPSHVIIMGGTNDAYAGIAVKEVINNIRTMAETAVENGITPILGLPISCDDVAEENLLRQYREEMRQFAGDNRIVMIDFHKAMVEENGVHIKENLHCDGIHPNHAGYEVMAGVADQVLRSIL